MRIERQKYQNVKSVGGGRTLGSLELLRCEFTGCALSQFDDPDFGLVVEDVVASRCVVKRCAVHGVRFKNVHVDRMTTTSMVHLAACVFQCVKLSGSVGSVMTTPPSHSISTEARSLFEENIKEQYRDVEWALDISKAEFVAADFYYVPGELVRRDEETQFLLHREKMASVNVGELGQYAQIAVSRFDISPFDSIVAVAPKKAKDFPEILADLQELRRLEVAE